MQEKLEKSQGEVYRLKAKLENAQQEQDSLRQELERTQGGVQRIHTDRDKVNLQSAIVRVGNFKYTFHYTKNSSRLWWN